MVAELRLLREMQLDVNSRTRSLEDIRKASKDGVNEGWERSLSRLVQKQGSVSKMTDELLQDFQAAREEADGGESGGAQKGKADTQKVDTQKADTEKAVEGE
jgi:hypothetical protein